MNQNRRMDEDNGIKTSGCDLTRNKGRADGWLEAVMAATGMGVRGVASELWDGHIEATRPLGGSWDVRPANASREVHGNYSCENARAGIPLRTSTSRSVVSYFVSHSIVSIGVLCANEGGG